VADQTDGTAGDSALSLGIDAYSLSEGSELRGIGTFLREIIAGLAAEPTFELTALATRAAQLPVGVQRLAMGPPGHPRVRAMRHDLRLPRLIRRSHVDVFYSPALSPPRRCNVPWLQTLHDLTPLVFDDPALAGERRRWLGLAPRLRRADAVVCDSNSSARQGIELLGLDPRKVHVAHLGVSSDFKPGPAKSAPRVPYLLIVGTWGPHKGFREAIAAVDAVAEAGLPHRLLVAGYQSTDTLRRIKEDTAKVRHGDRVHVLNHVPDIVDLYRGADAVLVPSHAEGFGLPALEALACGTPVVAADATSLPEVVGDAGLLLPAGDVDAWREGVVALLRDERRRADLSKRGPRHAAAYSWQATVSRYVELIRSMVR
jgi:glycosyltransferase involved in cell wall biosynthesis